MLDKNSAKVLRYIKEHTPTKEELSKNLSQVKHLSDILDYLLSDEQAAVFENMHAAASIEVNIHSKPGSSSQEIGNNSSSSSCERYQISPKGAAMLEDYTKRNRERIWTRGLAIGSIFVSLAALIVSIISLLQGPS